MVWFREQSLIFRECFTYLITKSTGLDMVDSDSALRLEQSLKTLLTEI